MRLYHGTSEANALEIAKVGLKPSPTQALNVWDLNREEPLGDNGDYTYLTGIEHVARRFAQFRKDYERAHPGEIVSWPGWFTNLYFRKNPNAPEPCTKCSDGAIIAFDIPLTVLDRLGIEEDASSGPEMDAYRTMATIPAEYVTEIRGLNGRVIWKRKGVL